MKSSSRILFFTLYLLVFALCGCKDSSQTCGYCGEIPGSVHQIAIKPPEQGCPTPLQNGQCVIAVTVDMHGCYELPNCQDWWHHLSRFAPDELRQILAPKLKR